jgi:nitrogen fixation/metabolism regulation signal transduction histidine kinase
LPPAGGVAAPAKYPPQAALTFNTAFKRVARCEVRKMALPRRKKKFIDVNVQGSLARRIIFHWLLFVLVASLASFILQVLTDPFRPLVDHLSDIWRTHGPFLLVLVFLLPVFVVDSIKLSHRFAGPVYALRRAIREIADGKPPRKLKFRRHDFWHDLAQDYNAMLMQLDLVNDEEKPAKKEALAASKK